MSIDLLSERQVVKGQLSERDGLDHSDGYLLMKQLIPCFRILSTFSFIFSFSAISISATLAMESTRTLEPKIWSHTSTISIIRTATTDPHKSVPVVGCLVQCIQLAPVVPV